MLHQIGPYSVEAAPQLPPLKLSMNRTQRLSKGTVVPPLVTQQLAARWSLYRLPPASQCTLRAQRQHCATGPVDEACVLAVFGAVADPGVPPQRS